MCDMTHLTHQLVPWLIDMWFDSYKCNDALICDLTDWHMTWLIDMTSAMTHGHVTRLMDLCHDSLIQLIRPYKVSIYMHIHVHIYIRISCINESWPYKLDQRVMAQIHESMRCLIVIGHFPQKSPLIGVSFAGENLQLIRHPVHRRHRVAPVHDSLTREMTHGDRPWLIHMCHDSFIRDMTHWHVRWLMEIGHDSFICAMTHSYVTWLVDMWDDSWR